MAIHICFSIFKFLLVADYDSCYTELGGAVMNKRFLAVVLSLYIFCTISATACADNWNHTVWIASGSTSAYRYHNTDTCPSLSHSVVGEITLQEAALAGFTPCEICKPPTPIPPIEVTPRPENSKDSNWGSFTTAAPDHIRKYTDSPIISTPNNDEPFYIFLGACAIILLAALFASCIIKRQRERKRLEEVERLKQEEYFAKKQEYEKTYKGVSVLALAQAPKDCLVGEDGLPACKKGDEKWGIEYTVYMTASGGSYHKKDCRIIQRKMFFPINAYEALHGSKSFRGNHHNHPCSICNPVLPDMSWYERYKKIESIKKRYEIE